MHEWTDNEVTNLYNRIIAIENQSAKVERDHKSQIDFLIKEVDGQDKIIEDLKVEINGHEKWLGVCDAAIKDLRMKKADKVVSEKSPVISKSWWFRKG